MRVAFFTDAFFPRINGVTVSISNFASELVKEGHEVCIFCLEYSEEQMEAIKFNPSEFEKHFPAKIVRIPSAKIIFSKEDRMAKLDAWEHFKKCVDSFRPDVLHINTEFTIAYFAAIYSRHRKIPYVYTFHTMWEDYFPNYIGFMPDSTSRLIARKLITFYLKHARVIIAPTSQIAQVVKNYGIEKDVNILPTGIPDAVFDKKLFAKKTKEMYKKSGFNKNAPILLFTGRVVWEKNIPFLFQLLQEVQKQVPLARLLIVGDGPALKELKEKATELGLDKSVYFAGYKKSEEMVYYYKMSTVFTFPSKTETQGLVTIEAMMQGLPVVAIGEMGTVNVMKGDNGGFMVRDDVKEFSDKVIRLLQNKELYEQKAKEALLWSEQWKISTLTPKLVECYKKSMEDIKSSD